MSNLLGLLCKEITEQSFPHLWSGGWSSNDNVANLTIALGKTLLRLMVYKQTPRNPGHVLARNCTFSSGDLPQRCGRGSLKTCNAAQRRAQGQLLADHFGGQALAPWRRSVFSCFSSSLAPSLVLGADPQNGPFPRKSLDWQPRAPLSRGQEPQ